MNMMLQSCPPVPLLNKVEHVSYDVFQRSCDFLYEAGQYLYQSPGHFLKGKSSAVMNLACFIATSFEEGRRDRLGSGVWYAPESRRRNRGDGGTGSTCPQHFVINKGVPFSFFKNVPFFLRKKCL